MSAAAALRGDDRLEAGLSPALRGAVDVPGDKSMSHRALILGALADGDTHIEGLLEGEDVLATAAAVGAFGATVERTGDGQWRIAGAQWRTPPLPVDCGNSGTGARLLMGAAAGFPIKATFTGDVSLNSRPMNRVVEPLRAMGADIDASAGGRLPATVRGGGLHGISFLNSKSSAQVKSAILLAGLRAHGEVEVIEPVPSRDHTELMLRAFGCDVDATGEHIRLGARRKLTGTGIRIPGDPSSAAFPLVAALVSPGSEISLRSVMINPLRAGLFATLQEMGADLIFENRRISGGEEVADIQVRSGTLRGVEVPASRAPSMIDEYPILAVAAAFATGRSVMHGLAELRVKESDRLAAVLAGLRACGVTAHVEGDSLIVEGCGGPPPGGASVAAHHDHRIAMSFLVMGLASRAAVTVDSAAMIATSFPGFTALMRSIGARIGR
jgi:3-phosphoshikimate 1-carboxyvinyltransferase